MKKKILAIAVIAICACICFGTTLAYFTAEDTAHNAITSGGVGITIVEKTLGDNGTELDFPAEGIQGIMPGSKASKIVSVSNTGASEAWIRVKVEISILGADGAALPTALEQPDRIIPIVTFVAEEEWVDGGDGYYYYSQPVPAGDKTGILFHEVAFAPEMPNEYQNCTAHIDITAEAVQTANNGIPAGGNVTDVLGWPETA